MAPTVKQTVSTPHRAESLSDTKERRSSACGGVGGGREKLDITRQEWDRFRAAMKNDQFRHQLAEYAREIADPENRRRYEREIEQLERERGYDVTWLRPTPGYVIKLRTCPEAPPTSTAAAAKVFINVCSSDLVQVARCESVKAAGRDKQVATTAAAGGGGGVRWSVPHCLSGPVRDCDKSGALCTVCDVIFHPDTLYMAGKNGRMRRLLEETAVTAVAKLCHVTLADLDSAGYPNIRYKGEVRAALLRQAHTTQPPATASSTDRRPAYKSSPQTPAAREEEAEMEEEETSAGAAVESLADHIQRKLNVNVTTTPSAAAAAAAVPDSATSTSSTSTTTPRYTLTYRHCASMSDAAIDRHCSCRASATPAAADELVVRVQLPGVATAAALDLQMSSRQLLLTGAGYRLQLSLPQPVDEAAGGATFCATSHCMEVVLPLVAAATTTATGYCTGKCRGVRHDSGVATDSEIESDRVLSVSSSPSDSPIASSCSPTDLPLLTNTRDGTCSMSLSEHSDDNHEHSSCQPSSEGGHLKAHTAAIVSGHSEAAAASTAGVVYLLPEYQLYQNNCSLVLQLTAVSQCPSTAAAAAAGGAATAVASTAAAAAGVSVVPGDNCITLTYESVGEGCVRLHYRLLLVAALPGQLDTTSGAVVSAPRCDGAAEGSALTVTVAKRGQCSLDSVKVGVDADSLVPVCVPFAPLTAPQPSHLKHSDNEAVCGEEEMRQSEKNDADLENKEFEKSDEEMENSIEELQKADETVEHQQLLTDRGAIAAAAAATADLVSKSGRHPACVSDGESVVFRTESESRVADSRRPRRGILKKSSVSDCWPVRQDGRDYCEDDDDDAREDTRWASSSLPSVWDSVGGGGSGGAKAVRFSQHVLEQRYRSDCSIVQDTARQARRRAKKRRQRSTRRHASGGDTSETDDQQTERSTRFCLTAAGAGAVRSGDWRAAAATSSSDLESSDTDSSARQCYAGASAALAAATAASALSKKSRKSAHRRGRQQKATAKNRMVMTDDE